MRLSGKTLLMLVSDGVDYGEVETLKQGFESEKAAVLVTTTQEFITVQSVQGVRRGADVLIDIPLDMVAETSFDGLIIPDGLLSVENLRKDGRVKDLILSFHKRGLPVFASGEASQLLYDSQVLFDRILIREGTPLQSFIERAVSILLDFPGKRTGYRA